MTRPPLALAGVAGAIAAAVLAGCGSSAPATAADTHTAPTDTHTAPTDTTAPESPGSTPRKATPAPATPEAVTQAPVTPQAIPTGRRGVPGGGLPPTATLTDPSPDVVGAAGLRAYYGSDTALDVSPVDAARRALPWTTGQLTDATRDYHPVAGPGAVWNGWAAHRAYVTVDPARAYDDGAPADTASTAYREYVLTLTPHGRDRWVGPTVTYTTFLTLTKTPAGWRIATLEQHR